ncbi:uncharacterized protein LOC115624327 [Scaptodrosophila lebanonensis]|uniref:Uncharacterized protein LOC115624327 n=1 Tax=Drosophila lebanonensis TaxID=7225 RepID=A0A6J2TH95_DROLE|nr:uncharacterized protein LOC115624327 [Scaptodrosophila lebanonensis]
MGDNNESYNEDELEAPAWLNSEFFADVLSKHENTSELNVNHVKISPASAKGDHYASVMFRGAVTYTCRNQTFTKSLIVKTMPEQEGHKKDMLGESRIFETEIGMYSEMLPKFEKILRAAGDNTVLHVPCLFYSLKPRKVMVFEDLVPQGYYVLRDRSMNIEELKCALSKLAKWHAVSFKLLKEDEVQFASFKDGLMEIPNFTEDPYIKNGIDLFIRLLDKVPELKQFKPYFEKMRSSHLKELENVLSEYRLDRKPNTYYVLSHGDFHLRNMMLKNNETTGAFEDCMLLDFQISNVCPFTVDVIYSFYMLMDEKQRQNHKDELLYFYFTTFTSTLQKIGCKGELPHIVEFRRQLFNHRHYEIFLVTTFLPMIFAMRGNFCDLGEVIQKEDARWRCYNQPEYIEDIKRILSEFLHQGYFEDSMQ